MKVSRRAVLCVATRPFQLCAGELELHSVDEVIQDFRGQSANSRNPSEPKPILQGSCRIFRLLPADVHQCACECRDLNQSG